MTTEPVWKRYLTDYNEGLGLVYERFVLNDFLLKLKGHHGFYSVLEAPLYGMAGVSGINSVILAQAGCEVTLVDDNAERAAGVRRIWDELGLEAAVLEIDASQWGRLPFDDGSFDHVFVCFVLEHLADPPKALIEMKRVLKSGGTITVIEGDHGSCFWNPETDESRKAWQAMIRVQQNLGHDPLIGRRLYPLLAQAGFEVKGVVPLWAYADARNPELLDGGINRILAPMMETAREEAIEQGLIDRATWEQGISDMHRASLPPDGSVFYTWFRGTAAKGY